MDEEQVTHGVTDQCDRSKRVVRKIHHSGGELTEFLRHRERRRNEHLPIDLVRKIPYPSGCCATIVFALILGAIMNPQIVISTTSMVPYIAAGIALVAFVSFVLLKVRSSRPPPTDDKTEPVIV